jgi:hypothetical protein
LPRIGWSMASSTACWKVFSTTSWRYGDWTTFEVDTDKTQTMAAAIRQILRRPALSFGSVVLWGLIELVALQRTRLKSRD